MSEARPIRRLLVANRGEIACRIFRTCREMGIETVAVHSDADADAMHVRQADRSVRIGPAPAAESYLRGERIIQAARETGADAIHPGYGFLSENADFAEAVIEAGLTWVGPPPSAIRAMGLKDAAKRLMEEAGVPVVPGYHGQAQDDATLRREGERIGVPLLLKAAAGGGGKGMRLVEDTAEFDAALESARREAKAAFGNSDMLVERFVTNPRHIEVQVLADAHGRTLALGTRDCSLQRRHQKVIEEAPAPGLTPAIEAAMLEAGRRAAEAVGYVNAGTIEFIADGAKLREALEAGSEEVPDGAFAFMEMNTRLQVEHPVTEESLGIDLVEWQLRVAGGEALPEPFPSDRAPRHAVEARLYAEDAGAGFLPATGTLHRLRLTGRRRFGSGRVRVDAGVRAGDVVTPHYDPMIAKLIGVAEDRKGAIETLAAALDRVQIAGTVTNLAFLRRLVDDPEFRAGTMDTGLIARQAEALTTDLPAAASTLGLAAMAAMDMLSAKPHAGFRLWGRARAYAELEDRGERITVCVVGPDGDGGYEIEVRERRAAFRLVHVEKRTDADVETLKVELAESSAGGSAERRRLTVVLHPGARAGERAVTVIGTDTHTFAIPDPLDRATAAASGDAVLAPMPGTLIALDVATGDAVEGGQRLAVLEAMKMEHALKAPRAGTVASVGGAVGAQVTAGDALVTLEPEDGG